MIIVDGTDLLGKTTLCRRLVEILNAQKLPHVYQHLSRLPEPWDRVWGYVGLLNRNVVMDRFHLSRQAYGIALDNQPVMNPHEVAVLEGMMAAFGCYTVLVAGSPEFIAKQHAERDDEMYSLEEIQKTGAVFDDMANQAYALNHSDYLIVANNRNWPSDAAELIVGQYLSRRKEVEQMEMRRPLWLDRR